VPVTPFHGGLGLLGKGLAGARFSFVQPFAPFSEANPLYDLISLAALHGSLVICGFVGTVLWLRHHVRQTRNPRRPRAPR
jgi:hypothetical protein